MELDGGFKCDCLDGYELGDDKVTCKGTIITGVDSIIIPTSYIAIPCS